MACAEELDMSKEPARKFAQKYPIKRHHMTIATIAKEKGMIKHPP